MLPEDLDKDGSIVFKWILDRQIEVVWAEFLEIEISGVF
jgi:hypothetical protein